MSSPAKAVFLDRDGVINKEVHHLHNVEDLRMLRGTGKAISALNKKGYRVVVISNQGMIAKGIGTHEDFHAISREIEKRLARQGATIDAIYYCPHHPEGSVKEYAMTCDCRKPEGGLVRRAAAEMNLDLKNSFMVGDQTRDILMGKRLGLKTILVATGYGGKDKKFEAAPDHVAKDLLAAATHYIS